MGGSASLGARRLLGMASLVGVLMRIGGTPAWAAMPSAGPVMGQMSLEQSLEERLTRALIPVLGDGRFIVQVKVRMALDQATYSDGRIPQLVGGTAPIVLNNAPTIPLVLPQAAPVMASPGGDAPALPVDPAIPLTPRLPGMPYPLARPSPLVVPPALPPAPTPEPSLSVASVPRSAISALPQHGLQVRSIRATLYLDRSVAPANEDFARTLVDRELLAFTDDETTEVIHRGLGTSLPAAPWLPMVAGLLLVLLLGVVAVFTALLMRRRPAPVLPLAMPAPVPTAPLLPGEPANPPETPRDLGLRTRLVPALVEDAALATTVLRRRLEQPEGYELAAALFQALGPMASTRTFRGLPSDERQRILELLATRTFDDEQVTAALEAFHRDLAIERAQRDLGRASGAFGFLWHLNDGQLRFVLEEEGPRVRAMALSQLPPKRAADFLAGLPDEDRRALTVALGELSEVPVTYYQDVAKILASRAARAPRVVVQDGIGALVGVLNAANPSTERQILSALETGNPEVARQIQARYLTLEDLPNLPVETLKDLMREISQQLDRRVVAKAIATAAPDVRETVLAALPSRARIVLQDALDDLTETPPGEEEAHLARRELLTRIRAGLKVGI